MKVIEWLLTGNDSYDEAVMFDADGNECEMWGDEDDAKYFANIIRIEDRDAYGCTANVYTDYRQAD